MASPLRHTSTHTFRMSLMPFFFSEKFLYLKINLQFQYSEKLSQTKTNLKSDYSCFENDTDVCFLLGPIKLWGILFVKISLSQCELHVNSERNLVGFAARKFHRSWNVWTSNVNTVKDIFSSILLGSPICARPIRKILLATGKRCERKSSFGLSTDFTLDNRVKGSLVSDLWLTRFDLFAGHAYWFWIIGNISDCIPFDNI